MKYPEYCSDCGKKFKGGDKAIAITGGTIDYKNYEGFRPNDDAYIKVLCPKCSNPLFKISEMKSALEEFVSDIESAYRNNLSELKGEWYDLWETFGKAKKMIK